MNVIRCAAGSRKPFGIGALAALLAIGALTVAAVPAAQATSISGTLFFTTFAGSQRVHRVPFSYDGSSNFSLGSVVDIPGGANIGADGLVFTSDGFLAVGGQGNIVYRVDPSGVAPTTSQNAGGTSAFHMMVSPNDTIFSSGIPGTPASYNSTLTNNGTAHPLSGDDTAVDSIMWPDTSDPDHAVYTSSGSGGFGNIGFIDLSTFTTTRVSSGVPAAHGGAYDPFTNTIILFGDGHITQLDPNTLAPIAGGDLAVSGVTFDQGTVDGAGHILVASNTGTLMFLDISGSHLVGSPDFSANPFLAAALDDVAPLIGPGGGPGPGGVPEPGSLALLGAGLAGLFGYRLRRRSPS